MYSVPHLNLFSKILHQIVISSAKFEGHEIEAELLARDNNGRNLCDLCKEISKGQAIGLEGKGSTKETQINILTRHVLTGFRREFYPLDSSSFEHYANSNSNSISKKSSIDIPMDKERVVKKVMSEVSPVIESHNQANKDQKFQKRWQEETKRWFGQSFGDGITDTDQEMDNKSTMAAI